MTQKEENNINTILANTEFHNQITPPADLNYVHQATADNTRKAYQSDIRHFIEWGGKLPTDTGTVVKYCETHATSLKPKTLQRRIIALRQFHHYQGFADPTAHPLVAKTLKGIANVHGMPANQALPLLFDDLNKIILQLNTNSSLSAIRNAAMLSLGFFAALRGSELTKVKVEDLSFEANGLVLLIPRSKTDQTGAGQTCAIPEQDNPLCPIRLIKKWLEISELKRGYLFVSINRWQKLGSKSISIQSLNNIVRQCAKHAGLSTAENLSSHSLRRGFATSASQVGASFKSIMAQGRWRHEGTVLEYIEAGQQFNDNAVSKLFEK